MRGLATLFAAILIWTEFLRMGEPNVNVVEDESMDGRRKDEGVKTARIGWSEKMNIPSKTRRQCQILLVSTFTLELQADVEHWVGLVRYFSASLAFNIALQQARKC